MVKPDDEYFEDERVHRRKFAYHDTKPNLELKNYVVALLIGFGLGVAGLVYAYRLHHEQRPEKPRKEYVARDFEKPKYGVPAPDEKPFKYFSIEAIVDGAGYDISNPLPANKVGSVYHVVIRNKRLDGSATECRRPINADAIEGLLACIEKSLKHDRRADYNPLEYKAFVEKLPDLDISGDAKTVTKADVDRAYDRVSGGLKAVIGE